MGHELIARPPLTVYASVSSRSRKISHCGCWNWITTLSTASCPLLPQFLPFNKVPFYLHFYLLLFIIEFHSSASYHLYSTVLHDRKLIDKVIFHCTCKMKLSSYRRNEITENSLIYNKTQLQRQKLIKQFNKLVFHFHLDYLSTQFKWNSRRIFNSKLVEHEKFMLKFYR